MMIPIVVSGDEIVRMKNLSFLVGTSSRAEFLSYLSYYPPIDFINHNLPPNAHVMSMGAQMCYHLQREYLSDESWDSTEWRRVLVRNVSLEEVNNDLKGRGITHILFSPSLFEFVARTGRQGSGAVEYMSNQRKEPFENGEELGSDYTSLRNWATFDLYRRKFLDPIYTEEWYQVYKLK